MFYVEAGLACFLTSQSRRVLLLLHQLGGALPSLMRRHNVSCLRAMGGDPTCSSRLQQQHACCLRGLAACNASE